MRFQDFKLLTFDTYGTLIDWETGIQRALAPLFRRMETPPERDPALEAFGRHEAAVQSEAPRMLYRDVLAEVFRRLAAEWGHDAVPAEADAFGRSVKDWPAFEDAPAALQYLRGRHLMATLTNCDRVSYMGSNARLELEWDAVITAQDVGAYKPDPRNFDVLLERARAEFGVLPHEILHVAQSLTHDMVPATRVGLAKVWIDRRHDQSGFGATKPPEGPYEVDARFPSMAAFVEAHRTELGA